MIPPASRSLISWRLVIAVAVLTHLDWHLSRPHTMRFSGDWSGHWVLGIITLGVGAWYIVKRWPAERWTVAAINLGVAFLLSQIVVPLGYSLFFGSLHDGSAPNYWHAFGQFLLAGSLPFLSIMIFWRGSARTA